MTSHSNLARTLLTRAFIRFLEQEPDRRFSFIDAADCASTRFLQSLGIKDLLYLGQLEELGWLSALHYEINSTVQPRQGRVAEILRKGLA